MKKMLLRSQAVGFTAHDAVSCSHGNACCNSTELKLSAAGIKNFRVLKTTQSGYEGFLHDKYTVLPDSYDRILATAITCTWK